MSATSSLSERGEIKVAVVVLAGGMVSVCLTTTVYWASKIVGKAECGRGSISRLLLPQLMEPPRCDRRPQFYGSRLLYGCIFCNLHRSIEVSIASGQASYPSRWSYPYLFSGSLHWPMDWGRPYPPNVLHVLHKRLEGRGQRKIDDCRVVAVVPLPRKGAGA